MNLIATAVVVGVVVVAFYWWYKGTNRAARIPVSLQPMTSNNDVSFYPINTFQGLAVAVPLPSLFSR